MLFPRLSTLECSTGWFRFVQLVCFAVQTSSVCFKHMYCYPFYISCVSCVDCQQSHEKEELTVGVLDIYGFEIFMVSVH